MRPGKNGGESLPYRDGRRELGMTHSHMVLKKLEKKALIIAALLQVAATLLLFPGRNDKSFTFIDDGKEGELFVRCAKWLLDIWGEKSRKDFSFLKKNTQSDSGEMRGMEKENRFPWKISFYGIIFTAHLQCNFCLFLWDFDFHGISITMEFCFKYKFGFLDSRSRFTYGGIMFHELLISLIPYFPWIKFPLWKGLLTILFVKYVLIVTSLVWGVILLIRANTCPTLLLFAEDKLLCLLSLSKRVLSLSLYPWREEHLPYLSFTMLVSDLCGKREKDKNCKVNSDGITPERIGIFMPFYIWRTHFFPLEKNAIKNFIKLHKFKFFKSQKKLAKTIK